MENRNVVDILDCFVSNFETKFILTIRLLACIYFTWPKSNLYVPATLIFPVKPESEYISNLKTVVFSAFLRLYFGLISIQSVA